MHLRGVFTLVLSLAMVMVILAGTGMEARAEGEYKTQYCNVSAEKDYTNLCAQCDVFDSNEKEGIAKWLGSTSITYPEDTVVVVCIKIGEGNAYLGWTPASSGWLSFSANGESRGNIQGYDDIKNYQAYYALKRGSTPSTPSTPSESQSGASHTHSYSWVTVQVVTAEQDGIEEYRCSCGDVQVRSIIPANMVFVKGLYGAIKDAPQGGTATFDSGRLYTISDYVIRKLVERPDVTTVITFEYQNQKYKMTIPAGVDYTSLLADEDYFYGYFYFANAVGATIEAL